MSSRIFSAKFVASFKTPVFSSHTVFRVPISSDLWIMVLIISLILLLLLSESFIDTVDYDFRGRSNFLFLTEVIFNNQKWNDPRILTEDPMGKVQRNPDYDLN